MKRFLCLAHCLAWAWLLADVAPAQDAAAAARRQEAMEDRTRTEGRIAALEEALQTFQRDQSNLRAQIDGLRSEMVRARNQGAGTPEALRELAAKIEEVDRKRQADNEKVLTELRRLQSSLTRRAGPGPSGTESGGPATSPKTRSDKQSEYSIKSGDRLVDIVKALNEQGVKITQEDIKKANPDVNWSKLRIGQKIIIPVAPPKP